MTVSTNGEGTYPPLPPQIANAWQHIFTYWHTSTWLAIPGEIKALLGLKPNLGMYSGMLITRCGAEGVQSFVFRLNHKKEG